MWILCRIRARSHLITFNFTAYYWLPFFNGVISLLDRSHPLKEELHVMPREYRSTASCESFNEVRTTFSGSFGTPNIDQKSPWIFLKFTNEIYCWRLNVLRCTCQFSVARSILCAKRTPASFGLIISTKNSKLPPVRMVNSSTSRTGSTQPGVTP